MTDTPKNDIKVENSENVTIVINDLASYEAFVKQRLDELSARLNAEHSKHLKAKTKKHKKKLGKLQTQFAEYERRLANSKAAYQDHQAKIAELEQLLQEATIDIGGNRIIDAQAAMEGGDYTIADEIFAEVEALEQEAVKRASRAAYGRGLVAEEQVRWADAATHYSKAARLDPTYETLAKAGTFLWRAGDHKSAIKFEEDLVVFSRQTYGEVHEKTATALNNLASSFRGAGNLEAAEPLFRQALDIFAKTIGTDHPDYAVQLNNLAGLLRAKGDYDAAEPLYRQALEIDAKTIGTDHPDYAIDLNNLAGLLRAKGDYDAAEPLFREAVSVMEAALGAEHPNSKTVRGNLESLLRDKP